MGELGREPKFPEAQSHTTPTSPHCFTEIVSLIIMDALINVNLHANFKLKSYTFDAALYYSNCEERYIHVLDVEGKTVMFSIFFVLKLVV